MVGEKAPMDGSGFELDSHAGVVPASPNTKAKHTEQGRQGWHLTCVFIDDVVSAVGIEPTTY